MSSASQALERSSRLSRSNNTHTAGPDRCSSPDLIVHAVLDRARPLEDIRADLKGIMSRLASSLYIYIASSAN